MKRKDTRGSKTRGTPPKYRPEFVGQAFKLALLGATDAVVARFFEVHPDTIDRWKIKHSDFYGSLKDGKVRADADVADSLYRKALGYEYFEEVVTKIKVSQYEEQVVVTKVLRVVPPDTTAMIFWLKNRQPEMWRDKIDHAHGGPDGGPIPIEVHDRNVAEFIALAKAVRMCVEAGSEFPRPIMIDVTPEPKEKETA